MKKIKEFFKGIISEMKKVKWPERKYIFKYTIVTVASVIVCSVYFYLIFILMSALKVVIR